MYRLGVVQSEPVHFGHLRRKCTGWGLFSLSRYILAILAENVPAGYLLFPARTFSVFWAKMYWLEVSYYQLVQSGHFGRKCTAWGLFNPSRYILAILAENLLGGNCLFSAATFSAFGAKMYRLGIIYSQEVRFGHFGGNSTSWSFFDPSQYIFGILGVNVPAGCIFILSRYILANFGQTCSG